MMKRLQAAVCASAAVLLILASASESQAQIRRVDDSGRNAISFNVGYFALRGFDSRPDDDVLVQDLSQGRYSLAFDVEDFNGATFGGEWLFAVSDYLEGGVGVGFYQRTVHSLYDDLVHADGTEIEQDLKLRIVPMSATVRFLPIGRGGVEPYVGVGIGVFNWRYSEVGEFVDDEQNDLTFTARYISNGTAVGPVVLGGVRFPVADVWTAGAELRYQKAEGKDLLDDEMLGDKIDLGGWSTSFTFGLRF